MSASATQGGHNYYENRCTFVYVMINEDQLSLAKVLHLTHLHLALSLGVTPFNFSRDLRHQKTRVPIGVVWVILRFTVSVQHRFVTDRQTRLRHIPR